MAVNNAITFMARDRSTTDEAYPGDIIGIPNHGTIRLGETFTEGEDLRFTGIPSFAPEHFRLARIANPLKIKQLQKGLQQLAEEGATQLFRPLSGTDLILGAVGTLQFDVVASRLEHEYGVQVIFENYNCSTARWIHGDPAELRQLSDRYSANVALDGADDPVYLAPNNVYLNMVKEKYPNLRFDEAREVI
jgi:peptide chain release factor 3